MVQPVSRSVEEVNRLECFIRTKVQLFLLGLGQAKGRFHPSPSSKHRVKTGADQDTGDGLTLVALNLNPSFLHRPSGAARLLHFFGESLFLRETDADEA